MQSFTEGCSTSLNTLASFHSLSHDIRVTWGNPDDRDEMVNSDTRCFVLLYYALEAGGNLSTELTPVRSDPERYSSRCIVGLCIVCA